MQRGIIGLVGCRMDIASLVEETERMREAVRVRIAQVGAKLKELHHLGVLHVMVGDEATARKIREVELRLSAEYDSAVAAFEALDSPKC